ISKVSGTFIMYLPRAGRFINADLLNVKHTQLHKFGWRKRQSGQESEKFIFIGQDAIFCLHVRVLSL
ncbi:MAG: hypothetical protein IKK97_05810, partial [Phascolarctobacterium sp.]|nr:hypothetical protein [Phascolarctobacterium sp.]